MPYSKSVPTYSNGCVSLDNFDQGPNLMHNERRDQVQEAICPAPAKGDRASVRLDHVRKALPCANDRWIMSTDTVGPAPAANTHFWTHRHTRLENCKRIWLKSEHLESFSSASEKYRQTRQKRLQCAWICAKNIELSEMVEQCQTTAKRWNLLLAAEMTESHRLL